MDVTVQETDKQRIDRELIELLNEIRVALPGVQVLFAFLLIAPFQSTWRDGATQLEVAAYMVALSAALASSLVLLTPSALHRFSFRQDNKERILRLSGNLVIAGMALLAVAMTASLLLVVDMILSTQAAIGLSIAAGAAFTLMWIVLPLAMRRGSHRE